MKHVKKSVLLSYSPREMYDLVVAVEDYPRFLPWCSQAQVLERRDDGITARLGLKMFGIRQSFTTRNVHTPGEAVNVHLVDGPFSMLEGTWLFQALAASGDAAVAPACKIDFEMRYDFASLALEAVVSPMFDRVANTLVDSFVKRAEAVYGAR